MKEQITTVSMRGNNVYKNALKALASARSVMLGDLVRSAIDAQLGEALKDYVSFFLDQSDHNNGQTSSDESNSKKDSVTN